MKKLIYIILIVLLILLTVTVCGSFYMFNVSLIPDSNVKNKDSMFIHMINGNPNIKPWADSMKTVKALKDTFIIMPNGERQHATFIRNDTANGKTTVLVHGYKGYGLQMLPIGSIYYRQLGCNIIMPDLHAHGLSKGEYIQMGWNDRKDIIHWMNVAEKMFKSPVHKSEISLHGVSMGAATVMSVSGEKLPSYLKCIVEDCGYTSVWDEFHHEIADSFGLRDFPLMYTTSILCKIRCGWSFGEASPLKQVAKTHIPMLFIHGDNDNFVPSWMVFPLYKAHHGKKEIWITHGCKHAQSYNDYPKEYAMHIKKFVLPLLNK